MPAITALTVSATAPFRRALAAFVARAGRGLKQFAERIRNRHDAMRLADLDDRMLADIGLNRSDLRDAYAELPWRDPSDVLARRAAERRIARHNAKTDCVTEARAPSAFVVAPPARCYPPADRPARYLV